MTEKEPDSKELQDEIIFQQRLDFYWRSITIYLIALIIYSLLIGTIDKGTFSIKILDPVVILLCIFIIITAFVFALNLYKKKLIIIGPDYIIFKSRFREKKYLVDDILSIQISKEKVGRVQDALRIIRIKLKTRKGPIIIRNSTFKDDEKLLSEMQRIQLKIKQHRTIQLSKKRKFFIKNKKNLH